MSARRIVARNGAGVAVSTAEYFMSHGKLPRGRGCWGFFFGHCRRSAMCREPWFAPGEQPYAEARAAAVEEAASRKFTWVEVGS